MWASETKGQAGMLYWGQLATLRAGWGKGQRRSIQRKPRSKVGRCAQLDPPRLRTELREAT